MVTGNEREVNDIQAEPSTCLEDQRSRGWFWDCNEVFESDLSKNAIIVRLYLAKCANGDRQAWPSLNTIAKCCKMSKPTVIKALKELEEKGWLQRIIRKRPNQEHDSTVYILKDPPPASTTVNSEGGSKIALPPVKNKTGGVVKQFYHPVKEFNHLVKQFYPNKTQGIIPNIDNTKLLVSSLRSDTNNSAVDFQSTDAVVDNKFQNNKNKCDSHLLAGVADEKGNEENNRDSHPQAGAANTTASGKKQRTMELPASKELIALLVKEYHAIEGIERTKGDYAFLGGLYNKYGYDCVLEAIYELSLAVAAQKIDKPLIYLKGILRNMENNYKQREGVRGDTARNEGSTPAKTEKTERQKKKEFIKSLYCN